MKILELCNFSSGVCGVWTRVYNESVKLADKGHEILVLSSDFVKGSKEKAKHVESMDNIRIKRYSGIHLGGEGFMHWFGKKAQEEALNYAPDVIIVHNYRQLHTTKALKIARRLKDKGKNCRVFLVTHAPFVEGNITRSNFSKASVSFYDKFIGPKTLKNFDKILAISNWEIPYLIKLGASKDKIEYIPNGIPQEFFSKKKFKVERKILFLGRISPKKKIETLMYSIPFLKDKKIKIEIVGPKEKVYFEQIEGIIKKLNLSGRVIISEPIYGIMEKINKIDSCCIFVLPSRVEGMPQSLIEAMAREKIVIGSDSIAIRDLINDKVNGFLFEFDNPLDLAGKIDQVLEMKKSYLLKIKSSAQKSVEKFSWNKVIGKIEDTIRNK